MLFFFGVTPKSYAGARRLFWRMNFNKLVYSPASALLPALDQAFKASHVLHTCTEMYIIKLKNQQSVTSCMMSEDNFENTNGKFEIKK